MAQRRKTVSSVPAEGGADSCCCGLTSLNGEMPFGHPPYIIPHVPPMGDMRP